MLVATDSAGEGIDLQAHCHRLVNFDIPFNPSRLEQRIGRIDRYGQTQPPEIFHLVPVASSTTYADDLAFMGRIAEKVGTIAADLGSVNQVIDADIQRHFARSGAPAPVAESRVRRHKRGEPDVGGRNRAEPPADRVVPHVRRSARVRCT